MAARSSVRNFSVHVARLEILEITNLEGTEKIGIIDFCCFDIFCFPSFSRIRVQASKIFLFNFRDLLNANFCKLEGTEHLETAIFCCFDIFVFLDFLELEFKRQKFLYSIFGIF